jgi:dTDP-4-dehydrorhamnose reductase
VKVAVLGADGMLGHEVVRGLAAAEHDVLAVTRRVPTGAAARALRDVPTISGVDVRQRDSVVDALAHATPNAVVNCVGIVKQRPEATYTLESIRVNALFPHELWALCRLAGARLLHISTDCVFSGRQGGYVEDDLPDPIDLYGRTKLLGEVDGEGALTLRTSIIGLELGRRDSLVEWFLRQPGAVKGWHRALYSGVTTFELARVLVRVLTEFPTLHGLWHVSADPVDKHTLLSKLRDALQLDTVIEPDGTVAIDRTLDSSRFQAVTGWCPPSWDSMLTELAGSVRRRGVVQDA